MKRADDKFDLPQGTLDLLIMRVVALGSIHGYAIAQRIQQISRDALQVQQGSLYPALYRRASRIGGAMRGNDSRA
jgi:DNA-binding PadR family transcriptional regulator